MAVYCCSDLHGQLNLYHKVCDIMTPNDKMIFLGDACDRGKYGWEIIKDILNKDNWTYLKGNHEDMLVKAFNKRHNTNFLYDYDINLYYENGGEFTFLDCLDDENNAEIIKQLNQLPLVTHYQNAKGIEFYFSHAGYSPNEGFNPYANASDKDLVWDRRHIRETSFKKIPDIYIIHGHTPNEYINEYVHDGHWMGKPFHSPYMYGKNTKIDIDAGSFYNHEVHIFNLDDFSFITIKDDMED